MTAALAVAGERDRVAWPHVLQLATIEARRYAMRVSVWIGWAATVAAAALTHPDWSGGSYENAIPLSFATMVPGVYVAGARTGSRDIDGDLPPLAEESSIEADDRLAARLLGLVMPVGLALLTTIGIAVVSRIEGGFWLGETPRRTDTALHSPLELLQPALMVALAGALGVVTGRAFRRPLLAIVAGGFAWFVLFPAYWIWNAPPLNVLVPAQTMPLRVPIDDVGSIRDLPADWLVAYPTQYEDDYVRDLVHLPTVAFHNLYLLGLVIVVGAAAGREYRRVLRRAGVVLVLVGIIAQLAVSPFGWTG
jgi:hypothetical protein